MEKEITINNLEQVDAVIAAISDNFVKQQEEQEHIIVKFDENITENQLVECLQKLWNYEIKEDKDIEILISNLSYNHRKEALRSALKTPQLKNSIFLMNVFCLVKGYNTFEESYFEHPQVFLNDEVEFLDIFDDLEEEIKEVTYKTAEYYVSMLKTCNLVEAVENNPNAVEIENLYVYLFDVMDVTILAKILSSVKDPSIWETKKIVLHSLGYLGQIAEKFVFTNTVMDLIGKSILENSIKESIISGAPIEQ